MLIVCPRCETTFSLPDALFKPGKKARCSNCGQVFPMSAPDGPPKTEPPAPDPAPKVAAVPKTAAAKVPFLVKYRKLLAGSAALFLLLFLGYGAWLIVGSFTGGSNGTETPPVAEKQVGPDAQAQADAQADKRNDSVSLDEIRQFQVDNTQIGKLMVIQGMAVNTSDSNKDFIAVEARILDANGHTLGEPVQQLCGVPLTLFQLQSLSAEELKTMLSNRITILTYNTNIPPGGKVPFVVVFPSPPANMKKFEVRVISVQDAAAS